MGSLLVRVVSGLAALSILGILYYFFQANGLFAITSIVIGLAGLEFSKITHKHISNFTGLALSIYSAIYSLSLLGCFFILVFVPNHSLALFSTIMALNISLLLWRFRTNNDSQRALNIICLSAIGFLYIPLLTHFAGRLLLEPRGVIWFCFLLAITFAGDTLAYFCGKWFGKAKLMPAISPKKTIAGGLGGLAGSAIAASIMLFVTDVAHAWTLPFLGMIVGLFAQMGDFFESLLKRTAGVKDSGRIMPGHGGILDRIDGVIFACPIYYALLQICVIA